MAQAARNVLGSLASLLGLASLVLILVLILLYLRLQAGQA